MRNPGQRGAYLRAVVRVKPQLGAELLLALTISPPRYRYKSDNNSDPLGSNYLETEGSDDIDVCTFKFLPLLYLFHINEVLAVDVVATLCNVATDYWHDHRWAKNQLEGNLKTDTDGVTLLIGNNRKRFKGGRHALYWHRNYPFSPRILACFLMTLEGWLYSRPTKAKLERSISIIFERADTVAMLGVLISLAKCDPRLLSDTLLPLISSLQLLLWLEFEQTDEGQNFGFDSTPYAFQSLSEEEGQEILDFRCQYYDLDAGAFIAHAAPKLMRRVQSEDALRATAFRCLIGVGDRNTSAFMRSWIKEYGLAHTLSQELINVAPWIARLIGLTYVISYNEAILQDTAPVPLITPPEITERVISLSNGEHPEIQETWSNLQAQFVAKKIPEVSIIDAFEWTPELLVPSLETVVPMLKYQFRDFKNNFDWDFLGAVLIPVLEVQPDSIATQDFITSLCNKALFTLLHQRETVYVDYKGAQREDGYSSVDTQLYTDQSRLLDAVVKSSPTEVPARLDILLHVLKTVGIVDCIILRHVIRTLHYCTVESNSSDVIDNSFRNYTVFAVGEYLFDLRNQQESDLRILGRVRDVWEKLIDLLTWESQEKENVENATLADQWLVQFFKRFQDVLLPDWRLRRKLYRVGSSTRYRQFRRVLFTALIQHQELLPTSRSEDSELLVQVLAELWDSDCTWVKDRPSCRDSLRILLGQLQEIDAVGARRLADQIADSLTHPSN